MASNNSTGCYAPSSRVSSQGKQGLVASGNGHAVPNNIYSRESDENTLLMMSSLVKMEATRGARSDSIKEDRFHPSKTSKSAHTDPDDATNCLDIVQQAITAVEDTLLRCTRHARHQALTELLTRAKLERAKKVTHVALGSDYFEHASVWAAMLQHVQGLGHDYPKEYEDHELDVHQLVYLVQQCVSRIKDHEVPEEEDDSENGGAQQQEVHDDDGLEQFGRMGEASVSVELASHEEDIEHTSTSGICDEEGESNQTEDESGAVVESQKLMDDHEKSASRVETEIEDFDEPVKQGSKRSKKAAPPTPKSRLRVLLPILTANIVVKGIQVPRFPRGSFGTSNTNDANQSSTSTSRGPAISSADRSSRLKFQFPDSDLLPLQEVGNGDTKHKVDSARSPGQHRRINPTTAITGMVPLRRKSFSMKRSPLKSASVSVFSPKSASSNTSGTNKAGSPGASLPAKQVWAARRKSTSACHINVSQSSVRRTSKVFSVTKHQIYTAISKKNAAESPNKSSMSSSMLASPKPSTQSQIVLRVRERTSDGVPELVIAKKPVRFVAWHWNDRCIRLPFMTAASIIELGPAQHGIMLRQLRYVKSMMHDLPWAKSHLRALLSKYTAKDVSKEELYPQLNALGHQVQQEMTDRAKQHRTLTTRKQRLTVTLTMATGVVNDTLITKFGRRGRPHATRLMYDPATPLQLRWRRKHGERSAEFLTVDEIQVVEVPDSNHSARLSSGAGTFGRGNKKAAAAVAVDPETCLSLVTPTRSLDLQVASALHREWLANAVRDIVSFAQQFKAARANACTADSDYTRDLMPSSNALVRRPRQLASARNVMLY